MKVELNINNVLQGISKELQWIIIGVILFLGNFVLRDFFPEVGPLKFVGLIGYLLIVLGLFKIWSDSKP